MKISIDIDGTKYNTIKEACEAYGTNYKTVGSRIRNGWPLEKAICTPAGHNISPGYVGIRKVIIEGKEFRSIRAACKEYDVNYQVVFDRMRRGMDIESAILALNNKCNRKSISVFNHEFKSRSELKIFYDVLTNVSKIYREKGQKGLEEFIIKSTICKKLSIGTQQYKYVDVNIDDNDVSIKINKRTLHGSCNAKYIDFCEDFDEAIKNVITQFE